MGADQCKRNTENNNKNKTAKHLPDDLSPCFIYQRKSEYFVKLAIPKQIAFSGFEFAKSLSL